MATPTEPSLHERIKAWREWAGLSRKKVASSIGVSVQTVVNWENGTENGGFNPKQAHLEKFADLVGISLAQFFGPLPPRKDAA